MFTTEIRPLRQLALSWFLFGVCGSTFAQSLNEYPISSAETRFDSLRSYPYPKSYYSPRTTVPDWNFYLRQLTHEGQSYNGDSAFTVLGRWAWGQCRAVAKRTNYALIGNGFLVQSLNVSHPDSPFVVSEFLSRSIVSDIKLRDSLAFVITGWGLQIINVSDLTHIELVGELRIPPVPNRIEFADSFTFVLTFFGGLKIVDISNPRQPFIRNQIPAGELSSCLATKGRIAYIGDREAPDMYMYNATNPDSIRRVFFPVGGYATYAYVDDSLLFVGLGNGANILKVFSITDRLNPRFLGQIRLGSEVIALCRAGNRLYAGTNDSGLIAINISNIAQPVILSRISRSVPSGFGGTSITCSDSLLYIGHSVGFWIVKATQNNSLENVSFFPTGSFIGRIAVRDKYLYVPQHNAGLRILDASNPSAIVPLGVAEFNNGSYDISLAGNYAFCLSYPRSDADTNSGLWVVDVSDVRNPLVVGHKYLPNQASGISVVQNCAYITMYNSGLVIMDVSNPYRPTVLGYYYRTSGTTFDVAVRDSFAYLAVADSGLLIVNIAEPAAPYQVSTVLRYAAGLALRNHFAFVAADSGFAIVDITDPRSPQVVGATITLGSRWQVEVALSARHAYLAYGGLYEVDVTNPVRPFVSAVLTRPPYPLPNAVALRNDTIFISDPSGIWVLRRSGVVSVQERENRYDPTSFRLYQNFPNPFNPQTTIGFFAPRREMIVVDVFDVLGQRVMTLFDGISEVGEHTLFVDGSRLASGVYLYRLTTSTNSLAKKMVIIR